MQLIFSDWENWFWLPKHKIVYKMASSSSMASPFDLISILWSWNQCVSVEKCSNLQQKGVGWIIEIGWIELHRKPLFYEIRFGGMTFERILRIIEWIWWTFVHPTWIQRNYKHDRINRIPTKDVQKSCPSVVRPVPATLHNIKLSLSNRFDFFLSLALKH